MTELADNYEVACKTGSKSNKKESQSKHMNFVDNFVVVKLFNENADDVTLLLM
jgi:hypothetical protein